MKAVFKIGQELSFVHGEHHRVATVKAVGNTKVLLSGMTRDYWISKEVLARKISRQYPVPRSTA